MASAPARNYVRTTERRRAPRAGAAIRLCEQESSVAVFKLPLSGDVPFSVAPWTNFGVLGDHASFFTVNVGQSSAPEVESRVLEDVGSYGRQLGRIGEALRVLVEAFDEHSLAPRQRKAIRAFLAMMDEIDDIKRAHGRETNAQP
jgi:hypothetical protein